MMRALHRWPGLLAALLLVVLSLSGAALSLFPAAERLSSPQAAATLSTADLAVRIQGSTPQVEQIRRAPSARSPPTGSRAARRRRRSSIRRPDEASPPPT